MDIDETVLLLDDGVDVAEEEEALVLLLPLLLIACTWAIAGCGIGCATSIEIVIIKTPDKRLYILGTFNRIFILQMTYHMNYYKRSSIQMQLKDKMNL